MKQVLWEIQSIDVRGWGVVAGKGRMSKRWESLAAAAGRSDGRGAYHLGSLLSIRLRLW